MEAFVAGKLQSLGAEIKGGLVVMTGRCARSLEVLVGQSALPVPLPSTRLAGLLLHQAHELGHKQDPRDALACAACAVTSLDNSGKTTGHISGEVLSCLQVEVD